MNTTAHDRYYSPLMADALDALDTRLCRTLVYVAEKIETPLWHRLLYGLAHEAVERHGPAGRRPIPGESRYRSPMLDDVISKITDALACALQCLAIRADDPRITNVLAAVADEAARRNAILACKFEVIAHGYLLDQIAEADAVETRLIAEGKLEPQPQRTEGVEWWPMGGGPE